MNVRPSITNPIGATLILLICLLVLSPQAWGATVISGNVSGVWTTNGSPYIVSATCTVASNQTLTIEPGVEVIFGPDVSLAVVGEISAIGTPDRPISIRGITPSDYWGTIELDSTDVTNRFNYCRFRDSGYDAIRVHVDGRNRVGIAEIINCEFSNCRRAAITGDALGISLMQAGGGSATIKCIVENCVFDSTGDGCMFLVYSAGPDPQNAEINAHITDNVFKNLSGAALNLYWDFSNAGATNYSRPVFINNTVINANRGVFVTYPRFVPRIENNLFVRTSNAVYRTSGGEPDFQPSYNCFHNNTADFVGFAGIYGIPVQVNHNGDPCDAFFNIFLEPRFFDTNRFLLSNSSPCIDAGDSAIADVCFQFSRGAALSDIGAYGGPDACGWLTHGFAPVITAPPASQSSCVGGSATFNVRVDGSAPVAYRWLLNGAALGSETNAQLTLANLQTNQAGLYSVAVSNPFGSVTSAPARLLVFDACVGINLYAGLSITGLVGRTYAIDWATNLSATEWLPLATNTLTEQRWLFIDTNTPVNPWRHFRVRLQP
jgi:hypothetical protein